MEKSSRFDEQGRPSFQLLQNSGASKPPIFFYAFDLLNRDGEDLVALPIERRRELLNELLADPTDPVRLSPLLQAPAGHILEAVQKLGLEGVVGKRIGSRYEPGERSGAWIKRRINRAQEFVIGGFVPGSRGFDSLIVGVYEKKRLQFVAKVRNGFVPRIRDEIFPDLKKLIIDDCPFVNLPEKKASRWGEALTAEKMKECRWVKPVLVCQVAFVEWTDGDKLGTAPLLGCGTTRRRRGLFGRLESNAHASAETDSHARGTSRQTRGETREAARGKCRSRCKNARRPTRLGAWRPSTTKRARNIIDGAGACGLLGLVLLALARADFTRPSCRPTDGSSTTPSTSKRSNSTPRSTPGQRPPRSRHGCDRRAAASSSTRSKRRN